MSSPMVSVICLSHNHERFVEKAIFSVLNQSYSAIELIVVDDASIDGSSSIIEGLMKRHGQIRFIGLKTNTGNCAAFNIGFTQSKGEYIIDLAADDVLLPNRIELGVKSLEDAGGEYGVQFSDAQLINQSGNNIGFHSDKYPHASIPLGDIYSELISRYFICGPSMMIRREVLVRLEGYDETLAYEDFDFWIRSSRNYKYLYLPKPLVKRRILADSMKSHQFKRASPQLRSTYLVCKKIKELNKTKEEEEALINRIRYEILVCLRLFDIGLALKYFWLWMSVKN